MLFKTNWERGSKRVDVKGEKPELASSGDDGSGGYYNNPGEEKPRLHKQFTQINKELI